MVEELVKPGWKTNLADEESLLPKVDWDQLQDYAVRLKGSRGQDKTRSCRISPQYNIGGLHLVRLLDFDDGTQWIARIQLHKSTEISSKRLLHEVHTLACVRERSRVPVPEIYGYEASDDNAVGVAFMLMEFVPGGTAMDSFGGPKVHHGEIPRIFKDKFYLDFAGIQTEMTSIRFPKIGRIIRLSDGSYDVEAIPGIGGPFETAGDYFEAWARSAKFPMSEETFSAYLPPHLAEQLTWSILNFPSRLGAIAHQLHTRPGPFPLYHPDLYQSNIIVEKNCNILSVIDWENASTVPWEAIEFPLFLQTVPPPMDLPENYTSDGQHIDEDEQKLWKEREQYVENVRQAERARNIDNNLSDNLGDRDIQNFATALKMYTFDGKMGYYCKVLEPFTANGQTDGTG